MANSRLCSIPECGKPSRKRGWCNAHYLEWYRKGDPSIKRMNTGKGATATFLEDVVLTYEGDECLTWPYCRSPNGRAYIGKGGRNTIVSRMVCEHSNGPPPSPKHHAAHSCGKGHLGCVNPHHLSWKTPAENMADKVEHGTSLRGERVSRSKLTEADVRTIRELSGSAPQHRIAKEFGINQSQVSRIISGSMWSWL